jgi:hypothetical protein
VTAGTENEGGSGPRRSPRVRQFAVGDELVLVMSHRQGEIPEDVADRQALTLNASGCAIWELCNGNRSPDEIVNVLAERFSVDRSQLFGQVGHALAELSRLEFIEDLHQVGPSGTTTTFVIAVEDKPYFWWQTAIFLESFRGKLPAGWRTFVVVCNNGQEISSELRKILERYDTAFAQGTNHANTHRIDIGKNGGECHAALNRVEALSVAGKTVSDKDLICLLDSDIFLYGSLNTEVMPKGCAAARNWHIENEKFFSTVEKNAGQGINLNKLLEAIGCDRPFLPGGVNVFVTGEVAKNPKFIADCYRFAHALFLLAHAVGIEVAWMAEMPCFALAMTVNGITYDLLENKELVVSDCDEASIPHGTLYHYYSDPGDFGRAAFRGSKWHKQAYRSDDFLRSDFEFYAGKANTDHERYFFQLAKQARARLDV